MVALRALHIHAEEHAADVAREGVGFGLAGEQELGGAVLFCVLSLGTEDGSDQLGVGRVGFEL